MKKPTFYRGETNDNDESVGRMTQNLAGQLTRRIDQEMQVHDLNAQQWKPLLMLRAGKADTAAEMARLNCSDNGAMTRMLDRLEAKGLVKRVRSAEDRRIVHLALTKEGERIADQIPYSLSKVLNEHLEGFSKDEFNQLKSLLRRMIANGERVAAQGEGDAE
jgi:DNA-binding MarR family transcriptional regulator